MLGILLPAQVVCSGVFGPCCVGAPHYESFLVELYEPRKNVLVLSMDLAAFDPGCHFAGGICLDVQDAVVWNVRLEMLNCQC